MTTFYFVTRQNESQIGNHHSFSSSSSSSFSSSALPFFAQENTLLKPLGGASTWSDWTPVVSDCSSMSRLQSMLVAVKQSPRSTMSTFNTCNTMSTFNTCNTMSTFNTCNIFCHCLVPEGSSFCSILPRAVCSTFRLNEVNEAFCGKKCKFNFCTCFLWKRD